MFPQDQDYSHNPQAQDSPEGAQVPNHPVHSPSQVPLQHFPVPQASVALALVVASADSLVDQGASAQQHHQGLSVSLISEHSPRARLALTVLSHPVPMEALVRSLLEVVLPPLVHSMDLGLEVLPELLRLISRTFLDRRQLRFLLSLLKV